MPDGVPSQVHLTFDNGPHPEVTPVVLKVLAQRGLTATFFVLGKHLATEEGMTLAKQIRDAGHRLGNHSYTHEIPLGEDPRPEAVSQELEATQALLDQVWEGPRWFRPFGGGGILGPHLLSEESVSWLLQRSFTCVLWNSVPGDWKEPQAWVERALDDAETLSHSVVVLHDILPEAMRHLDRYLGSLEDRGHTFTDTFPLTCTPIIEGRPQPALSQFVQVP